MRIGVISDTHGSFYWAKKAIEYLSDCDYIIHCGDVLYHGPRNDLPEDYNPRKLAEFLSEQENIYYIKGNCDSDVDEMVIGYDLQSKSRILEIGNDKIYAIHGYEETCEDRMSKAKEVDANILITGHSHVKLLKKENGLIILNPGSTSIPKDGSNSLAIIEDDNISLVNLNDFVTISNLKK